MNRILTENQHLAVHGLRGRSVLVSASAGTGKTTVMIERIAALISSGIAAIDSVLVVTFTTAAAKEMKSRLHKLLKARAAAGDANCLSAAEKCDEAAISTLHSICAEIVRSYFYLVGVDPSFYILDDSAAARLKRRALDSVRKKIYAAPPPALQTLIKVCDSRRGDEGLFGEINSLFEFSRCLPEFDTWVESVRQGFEKPDAFFEYLNAEIVSECNFYAGQFDRLAVLARNAGAPRLAGYCADAAAAVRMRAENGFAANYQNLQGVKFARLDGSLIASKTAPVPSEHEALLERVAGVKERALDSVRAFTSRLGKKTAAELSSENAQMLPVVNCLLDLTHDFSAAYAVAKHESGALDFADLEHLTLEILQSADALEQLKIRFKTIFVDEYQDINGVQEAILSRLCTETNAFYVGDVKQSIYAFRQCHPRYFLEKRNRFAAAQMSETPDSPALVLLNDNFRSRKEILAFANAVFAPLMTDGFGGSDYKNSAMLTGGTEKCEPADAAVTVKFPSARRAASNAPAAPYDISAGENAASSAAVPSASELEAAEAVAFIKSVVGKTYEINGEKTVVKYGDIAVLMSALTADGQIMYHALVSSGIPVVSTLKSGRMPKEMKDVTNFLRALDNPLCDIPLAGCALSHFGGFTPDELAKVKLAAPSLPTFYETLTAFANSENAPDTALRDKVRSFLQTLEYWRLAAQSQTVPSLIAALIRQTGYDLYLLSLRGGKMRQTRLNNLICTLKDAPHAKSVDKYLAYLSQATGTDKSTEPASAGAVSDCVRLTTIHKSKGLEFKVVIGAGLSKSYNNTQDRFIKDFNLGIGVASCDTELMLRKHSISSLALTLRQAREKHEEQMRLLYVLCTRAKLRLHLIISPPGKEIFSPRDARSHAELLAFSGAEPYTAELRRWQAANAANTEPQTSDAGALDEPVGTDSISARHICHSECGEESQPCSSPMPDEISENEFLALVRDIDYKYPYQTPFETPAKIVSSALRPGDAAFEGNGNDASDAASGGAVVRLAETDINARIGTAYHKLFEKCAPADTLDAVRERLGALVAAGGIAAEIAAEVAPESVCACMQNPEFVRLAASCRMYHELPFMLQTPYNSIFSANENAENVVLQGVIDVLLVGEDYAAAIDFKFSRAGEEEIKRRYTPQLASYALAAKQILKVSRAEAYAFSVLQNKLIRVV